MKTVSFTVFGVAQPKGSIRAFQPKGMKRPVLTSTNKNLGQWSALVRHVAQRHAAAGVYFGSGEGVNVELKFALPRPSSIPKKVQHHVRKPDVDKLTRAVLDALTGTVFHDDSQVGAILAIKEYAERDFPPCVKVSVQEAYYNEHEPYAGRDMSQPNEDVDG